MSTQGIPYIRVIIENFGKHFLGFQSLDPGHWTDEFVELNSGSRLLWQFHLRRKKSVSLDRLDMDIEGWTHQQQPLESQSCGRSGKLFMKKLPLNGARTSLEGNYSPGRVRLHRGKSLRIHHKMFQLYQRVFGWC